LLCCRLAVSALIVGVVGCSRKYHKAEADKEVYKIIDQKWQDQFGKKVNYVVNDVSPEAKKPPVTKEVPTSGVLTLAQSVQIATENNRDYQKQKEQLYLKALDLTLVRHDFVRKWFGTVDAQYVRDREDEKIKSGAGVSGTKLGFNQLLADGAQISAGIAIDWVSFLTGDSRTTLGSLLSASIRQPLLRGAGRKIVQEKLTQAEQDALYQIRDFNRFRQTFVVSVVTDYYRVLQTRDSVTNAHNNYKRLVKLTEQLQMQAEAGRKKGFEVDQAKQNELRAWDSYVRTEQNYQQQLDEFKIRLALPTDAEIELDQNELKALAEKQVSEPDYELTTSVETAILSRLDLANSKDQIDDAVRKVMVAADGLGAGLDLIGSAGVSSGDDKRFERLRFQDDTYKLGIEADLPLDRKVERNAYREALISLEQRQRTYENDIDEVKLDVRQAYRRLREAAERYRIQKNSLELAKKRVESTSLLLDAGRAQTRDLLESEDAFLAAQNDLSSALVDHVIAKLSFFRDIGILQVQPDGMWQKR
jgi:outer membrane protein TolC